jgi:adenosylhomocysteine nucleosidase
VSRIAVFAALQWECAPVARRLRRAQRITIGNFQGWRGECARGEVWLLKTGIGLQRAYAAAQAAAEAARFELFISTGCAGALAPQLQPGDLTIATRIISMTCAPIETDTAQRERAQALAQQASVPSHVGTILCSPEVLATCAAKQAAAERYGALAVEMEGEPLAMCAGNLGVPFISARAILDTADTEMRHAGRFVDPANGKVRPFALAAYLARHPLAIGELRSAQQMMSAAQRSLNQFFDVWLATA